MINHESVSLIKNQYLMHAEVKNQKFYSKNLKHKYVECIEFREK